MEARGAFPHETPLWVDLDYAAEGFGLAAGISVRWERRGLEAEE